MNRSNCVFSGSPIELDSENNLSHSDQTSLHSVTQLELPVPERLLPIGSVPTLVQHVRHVLGVKCDQGNLNFYKYIMYHISS